MTKAGQEEFLRLLRGALRGVERNYPTIDIGLAFREALPKEEAQGLLQGRVAELEAILEHVHEHRGEQLANQEVPRSAAAVFDHGLALFQAELDWTRDILDKMERGEYP
jgi:hypothetical protein